MKDKNQKKTETYGGKDFWNKWFLTYKAGLEY